MLLCVGSLIACTSVFAQAPFHYLIGEEALAGVEVYSILQDDKANMWIASDHGLFRYDGYAFHPCQGENLTDVSLFSLTKDDSGRVYCLNLSGQIFQTQADSLMLYYQIPDSLLASLMSIAIDDQGDLVVACRAMFKVSSDKSVEVIAGPMAEVIEEADHSLSCVDIMEDRFFKYVNGEIQLLPLPFSLRRRTEMRYFSNGSHRRFLNTENLDQYLLSGQFESAAVPVPADFPKGFPSMYATLSSEGQMWLASNQGGVVVLDSTGKSVYGDGKIFEKYLVSWKIEDREGNQWLGTKGRGILVLPNLRVLDFSKHPRFEEAKIIGLAVAEDGQVYVNTEAGGGKIFRIDRNGEVEELALPLGGAAGEFFEVLGNGRYLGVNGSRGGIWDFQESRLLPINLSSIKDGQMVGPQELMWLNERGLYLEKWGADTSVAFSKIFAMPDLIRNRGATCMFLTGRSKCCAYEKDSARIWVGRNKGLFVIDAQGMREVRADGKVVMGQDIELVGDQVWVATGNAGMYCFQGERLEHHLEEGDGLLSNEVGKLQYREGYLYLMSRRGLQRMDLEDFSLNSFGPKDGLLPGAILDFGVAGDDIWLYTLNGLQKFRFADLKRNLVPPTLEIQAIRVNELPIAADAEMEFTHDQNKFEFEYIGKGYRHRGELKYRYRMHGWDPEWQEKAAGERKVTYNALPPGDFEFEIVAVNEDGVFSAPFRYPFRIAQPYWLKWWFWLGCILLLVAIISAFFLVRIRVLRRSLILEKKLKNSELVAIKAQMNPHFVFNVLNSFQDLIYQQDFRKTNAYLGKFAGLMRKTLEFSDQESISLAEEIELLEAYLDLEKLRFGEEFEVELTQNLAPYDAESLTLPSMLLQPYIENAIKHGLLHRQGIKRLQIRFEHVNGRLVCEIQDNGIGRKASEEIKQRRSKYHQPFASTATQKRIDLMNESREEQIGIEVEDLWEENGQAKGTLVRVSFPVAKRN